MSCLSLPEFKELYDIRSPMTLLGVSLEKEKEIEDKVSAFVEVKPDDPPVWNVFLYSLVKAYAFYKARIGISSNQMVVVTDREIDASLKSILSQGILNDYFDRWKCFVRRDVQLAYFKNRTDSILKPHLLGLIGEKYRLASEKAAVVLRDFKDEGMLEETQNSYRISKLLHP